jgi:hypothetical protein
MTTPTYTTGLGAGLGIIEETRILLDLWVPGIDRRELYQAALKSGQFPSMSARRLRNLIVEAFASRYLNGGSNVTLRLKMLKDRLSNREFEQILFLYTCRANAVLADFVRDVYWTAYAAGRDRLSNEEAQAFVVQANRDGKTTTSWSDNMMERVAGYLTRCCADFGLLEPGVRRTRKILTYRIEPRVVAILAYDLHLAGHGDNAILAYPDWELFGLERADVLEEMKQLALRNLLILQSAGGITKISWQYNDMQELIDVLTRNEL